MDVNISRIWFGSSTWCITFAKSHYGSICLNCIKIVTLSKMAYSVLHGIQMSSQTAITCSKLTIETLELGWKYVES